MFSDNLKIQIVLKNKSSLLANANVCLETVFFGYITIKGFQVWRSRNFNERLQEKINIAPPTKYAYGKYIQQVFFETKDKWYELETKIYEAYLNERSKNGNGPRFDMYGEEIVEELPL